MNTLAFEIGGDQQANLLEMSWPVPDPEGSQGDRRRDKNRTTR